MMSDARLREDICRFAASMFARGLTGEQGVLIPEANVRHLMLREDVVAAVEVGLFTIYAVATIDLDRVRVVREDRQLIQYREPAAYRAVVKKY